jgi:hypothetical protein
VSNASELLPDPDGPGDDGVAPARDLEVEPLEVVLPRAADDDAVFHVSNLAEQRPKST